MKKNLLALAAVIALGCASAAFAKTPYRIMNVKESAIKSTEFELTDVQEVNFDTKYRYSVTAVSANTDMGTIVSESNGDYKVDEQVKVVAAPNEGYRFVEWQNSDGDIISTNFTYIFNMPETDLVLTAIFEVRVIDPSDHAYVDLGLTSGILWATCNIGATNPEDAGDYFAWGETDATKENFIADTYTLSLVNDSKINPYISEGTTLQSTHDAATTLWEGDWHIPTKGQWQELIDECTWENTTINGKSVAKITKSGSDGVLYLPIAGYYKGSSRLNTSMGYYWTSDCFYVAHGYAYQRTTSNLFNTIEKYYGLPIRPVK